MIILAGAVSIPTLPIAQYPELAPPQVTVTSIYTGASAQVVESAVTTPLEQVINGVEGMAYIDVDQRQRRHQHHHGDVRRQPQPGPRGRRRAEPDLAG